MQCCRSDRRVLSSPRALGHKASIYRMQRDIASGTRGEMPGNLSGQKSGLKVEKSRGTSDDPMMLQLLNLLYFQISIINNTGGAPKVHGLAWSMDDDLLL